MNLVALYGVGDAYLVCALARAYQAHHGVHAEVVLKTRHEAVAQMFDVPYRLDDVSVSAFESGTWDTRDNPSGGALVVHPHLVKTRTRLDQLTISAHPTTQADMYRALMGLPPDACLERGKRPTVTPHNGALLLPEARSWPNLLRSEWADLAAALSVEGWEVQFVDPNWSLSELFVQIASCSWLIAPQCGVLSVACHALFPCRKTIIAPPSGFYGLSHAFPYGYTTKFAGEDYDVEEIDVS